MPNVILHFADWNWNDKYYSLPLTLLREFKENLKANGFTKAWEWLTPMVDYDDAPDKPVKRLQYIPTDADDTSFFLDYENVDECIAEWDEQLEDPDTFETEFDYFYLEGFGWCDLLDFLKIPHYTNQHRGDTKPKSFAIRTVPLPDLDEEDEQLITQQLLVVWDGPIPPSDQEIQDKYRKDWKDYDE